MSTERRQHEMTSAVDHTTLEVAMPLMHTTMRARSLLLGGILAVLCVSWTLLGWPTVASGTTFGPVKFLTVSRFAATWASGVACPSDVLCVAVGSSGSEVTFDPRVASTAVPSVMIAPEYERLLSVACPSITQCAAISTAAELTFNEVTFNPSTPRPPSLVAISATSGAPNIACPSSAACTSLDNAGAVTFDPASNVLDTLTIPQNSRPTDLACPAVNQCTEVTVNGEAVTFNPIARTTSAAIVIDTIPHPIDPRMTPFGPGTPLTRIACPTRSECVALDESGNVFAFNPTSPRTSIIVTREPRALAGSQYLDLACPSATQCTIISEYHGVTLDPAQPNSATSFFWKAEDTLGWMTAVACPSTTQCTAVTGIGGGTSARAEGEAVTFNPNPTGTTTPSWTPNQCKRTRNRWARQHRHASRRRRQAETKTLHREHGCSE
jgi:hypothetical protein